MSNPEVRVSQNTMIAELSTSHQDMPAVQTVHLTRVVADPGSAAKGFRPRVSNGFLIVWGSPGTATAM